MDKHELSEIAEILRTDFFRKGQVHQNENQRRRSDDKPSMDPLKSILAVIAIITALTAIIMPITGTIDGLRTEVRALEVRLVKSVDEIKTREKEETVSQNNAFDDKHVTIEKHFEEMIHNTRDSCSTTTAKLESRILRLEDGDGADKEINAEVRIMRERMHSAEQLLQDRGANIAKVDVLYEWMKESLKKKNI